MSDSRSRAFLYGESVFTTLRVERGKPFFAQAHKARLQRSAEWLWVGAGALVERLWDEAMVQCPEGNGTWRLTVHQTGERGHWRSSLKELALDQWWSPGLPAVAPVRLRSCQVTPRDTAWPSYAKTSDYLSRMIAARALPADEEPLFCTGETVCEAMFSNLVFVEGNTISTPAPGSNVLSGIGLLRLRHLARREGFKWSERTVLCSELSQFNTAWLVNAVRGLTPVSGIDGNNTSAHPMEQHFVREFFASEDVD